MRDVSAYLGIFLSGNGDLQCGSGFVPQFWKNQHDDVPFDCIECDQRSRKLYRRLCFAYRCAWRCGSVADCAYLFRACYTVLCFSKRNPVQYLKEWIFKVDLSFQKTILSIAVPNGIESGIFQLVKVALSSVVALFGTYQIAANGIAQSIWSMAALTSSALSPVFITVIGQCMGAGDTDQAEYYFRKLIKITLIIGVAWNALVFAVTPFVLSFYAVSEETKRLTLWLVLLHNIFNGIALCYAGPLGSGLRATGDVKFTMGISLFTTIGVRLIFSVIFAIWMNMGVMGIALAMCLDWSVRGIIFWWRFKQGKWKTFQVIRE